MKQNEKSPIIILCILLLLLGTSFTYASSSKNFSSRDTQKERTLDGQILFSPYSATTTYLIDSTGTVNHTWPSAYHPFTEPYWLGNGTILRPIISGNGGLQVISWDGTIVWDYRYTVPGCSCHHDVKLLPNGNVLMIVWETKTRTEAIAAGRNPSTISGSTFKPDRIIEVNQTGPTSGAVVWEWHVWDHLIQDYDASKANYGIVGDHPELIDVNFGDTFAGDWLHTNCLDYNPTFDQILISSHNFNEIWVIDHSTTTAEAASHAGGNSGKGGDLLYRWGNPRAYDAGTTGDQKLFFQHGVSWIKPGYPGAGHILVFDNGNNRPSGQYSTVDEFAPPVNSTGEYSLVPGSAYGPEDYTWSYTADPPTSFYSNVFGDAHRLKTGDTLICDGTSGRFFEVTPDGTTVWQYINPYPNPTQNSVFKIDYLPPPESPEPSIPDLSCSGSLSWTDIKPGTTLSGTFQVGNIGEPSSLLNWTITSYPNWGAWTFTPSSGTELTASSWVTVNATCVAPNEKNTQYTGTIQVTNVDDSTDNCSIPVSLKTPTNLDRQFQLFMKELFARFPNAFPLLRYFLKE